MKTKTTKASAQPKPPGFHNGRPCRLSAIAVPETARPLDAAAVTALAHSIQEVGLLNPLVVKQFDGGTTAEPGTVLLVAGRRRLAAMRELGLEYGPVVDVLDVVPYDVFEKVYDDGEGDAAQKAVLGNLIADLIELDENLIRSELTPAQRAEATAKRKVIWEQIHPDATAEEKRKEGAAKTHAKLGRGKTAAKDAPLRSSGASSFVNDTASKTGRSAASVRRDAQIGAALAESPEAAAIVEAAPKPIAQSELLAIAQAPKGERKAAAEKAVEKAKAPRQYGPGKGRKPRPSKAPKASSTTVEATDQSPRFPPDWQPTAEEEELVAGILQVPRPPTVEPTDETPPTAPPVLSDRDQKIHDLYRASRTTKEIAEELGLSVSVVQTAKGRLGFVKRAPDNPFHGLIFNVECLASTLRNGNWSDVLQKKPATAEHIAEAVAALDKLTAAAAHARARLLAGTFGEDEDEDEDDEDTAAEQEGKP